MMGVRGLVLLAGLAGLPSAGLAGLLSAGQAGLSSAQGPVL